MKTGQGNCAGSHTINVVLPLSFPYAVALPMVLTTYYVLTARQSLRHGFAVPPPFTQGRLWCDAKLQIAQYDLPGGVFSIGNVNFFGIMSGGG